MNGDVAADGSVDPALLPAVLRFIRERHDRAVAARRDHLRVDLTLALRHHGVAAIMHRSDYLEVTSPAPSAATGGPVNYALRLAPRPPRLRDFRRLETSPQGHARAVIGPLCGLSDAQAVDLEWLARTSGIGEFDEGRMLDLAYRVAAGQNPLR